MGIVDIYTSSGIRKRLCLYQGARASHNGVMRDYVCFDPRYGGKREFPYNHTQVCDYPRGRYPLLAIPCDLTHLQQLL